MREYRRDLKHVRIQGLPSRDWSREVVVILRVTGRVFPLPAFAAMGLRAL